MRAGALALLLPLLAACSAEREPAPEPTPRVTMAAPRTLVPADFDPESLGPRAAGFETAGEIGESLARVSGFVACPREMAACDPAKAPEGTVFTYVLIVTPATGPVSTPSPEEAARELPAPAEAPPELVRMIRPAAGFNGAVGFDRAEAAAALGAEEALTVTLDQNRIIWRVTGGSGWKGGKPITLWWQSTSPPQKPAPAYRLEYGGRQADIPAAFPVTDKGAERKG